MTTTQRTTTYKPLSITDNADDMDLDFDIELNDDNLCHDDDDDDEEEDNNHDNPTKHRSDLRRALHPNGSCCPTGSSSNNDPPANYICPLRLSVMTEPMNDSCGHTFEREAIIDWLEYHERCPISLKPLTLAELHPNQPLATRIQQWKVDHGDRGAGGGDGEVPFDEEEDSCCRVMKDDILNRHDDESLSKMERMLLPQERKVFQFIHHRSADLRRVREKKHCIWTFVAIAVGIILVAAFVALKNLQEAEDG